jgi:hypothetical protein
MDYSRSYPADNKLGDIIIRCDKCGSELEADSSDLRSKSTHAVWEYTSSDWKRYKKGSEATLDEWKEATCNLPNREDTSEGLPSGLELSGEQDRYWRNVTTVLLISPVVISILHILGGDFASSIISGFYLFIILMITVLFTFPFLTAYTISKDIGQRSQYAGVDNLSMFQVLAWIVLSAGIYPIYYIFKY